jgi:hypothetical protein
VNASDPADAQGNFRQFQIQLLGVSARGQTIQTNVTWTVRDSRLNPIISAPANLAGFANLSFSVAARNPNRDGAPVIRLLTQPNIGRVNLQTVTTPSSESLSIVNVNWTDQPFDQLGTTHAFVFQVCLASNTAPLCQNHRIDVLLQGELREAPAFDRAAFALGEVKAIKVGEQVNINLPIRDLDNQQPITSATIELSSSTLAEVAWVNGRLAIKGLAPGLLQFNVVARSAYGLTKKESFLVQVSEPTP